MVTSFGTKGSKWMGKDFAVRKCQESSRKSRFTRWLDTFKNEEKAESTLVLAEDKKLTRLLLAWQRTNVVQKRRPPKAPEADNTNGRWDWLWSCVTFSTDDIASVAGLEPRQIVSGLAILRGNRLIYPDGTISRFAAQFLRVKTAGLFRLGNRRSIRNATVAEASDS